MVRAAIYERISRVKRNGGEETLGVERQEPPCRDLCARKGWTVAKVYVDNDLSAYSGRHRPEYEQMLHDLEAGAIDAIVAWHADRLTRRPVENETLIELAERYGVELATVTGEHDLSTPSGRLHFRMLGSIARYESEHRAERVQLKKAELAQAGKPPGGGYRPFGYEPDGVTIREAEAALIRDAARRLIRGESAYAILADWHTHGVITTAGKPWRATPLRRILCSPRVAGLREHRGQIVGSAAWPAILDEQTWRRVRGIYADRVGRKRHGRGRRFLLTGWAVCGWPDCGKPLVAGVSKVAAYRCRTEPPWNGCGRLHVGKELLEAEVSGRVIHALAGPKLVEIRNRAAKGDAEAERLEAERRAAEADLEHLAHLHGAGQLKAGEWLAARGPLAARMEAAERALARRPKLAALADLPDTKAELEDAWAGWTVDRRRSVLKGVLDAVIVLPVGKGQGKRFDPNRVRCRWLV